MGTLKVSARGSGTVETAEGTFFVPEKRMREAMNGDSVQVRPLGDYHGSMPMAAVHSVVERKVTTFAATYIEDGQLKVLVPLDDRLLHDFVVLPSDPAPERLGLVSDDLVCGRIVRYPTRRDAGVATVERKIGDEEGETVAIEAIIASHDLAVSFPQEALDQARNLKLDIAAALAEPARKDLRDRFVVTVDPDDARDFDDALSLEPRPEGGWVLGVHIADVSAYVPWGSPLDLAARERATSTYLADRVLPMLPEELSNELCSLKPHEDRLAVTVDLILNERARVVKATFYPSVIRSKARLTYRQVDQLLEGTQPFGLPQAIEDVELAPFFSQLDQISTLRRQMRRDRGAIEFVSSEAKVILDEQGHPVGVTVRRPTPATMLVEEAMLAANEAVARRLDLANVPNAFRVHEPPAEDNLAALVPILTELGCLDGPTKAGLIAADPHAVQAVLDVVAGKPEEELVSSLLLRAMRRAVYAPVDEGHFGLGATAYCHFTSPIRRYSDLVAHRSLKAVVAGGMKATWARELEAALPTICKRASKMEREAAAAAYESQAVKLAEYMGGFVGQVFEGVVTSVHPFGLFVRLRETSAEGLLHVRDLGPGWWSFDEDRMELACDGTDERYRLGQPLDVRVRSTDAFRGRVDFALPKPL